MTKNILFIHVFTPVGDFMYLLYVELISMRELINIFLVESIVEG